jgi:hypothetical protein
MNFIERFFGSLTEGAVYEHAGIEPLKVAVKYFAVATLFGALIFSVFSAVRTASWVRTNITEALVTEVKSKIPADFSITFENGIATTSYPLPIHIGKEDINSLANISARLRVRNQDFLPETIFYLDTRQTLAHSLQGTSTPFIGVYQDGYAVYTQERGEGKMEQRRFSSSYRDVITSGEILTFVDGLYSFIKNLWLVLLFGGLVVTYVWEWAALGTLALVALVARVIRRDTNEKFSVYFAWTLYAYTWPSIVAWILFIFGIAPFVSIPGDIFFGSVVLAIVLWNVRKRAVRSPHASVQ